MKWEAFLSAAVVPALLAAPALPEEPIPAAGAAQAPAPLPRLPAKRVVEFRNRFYQGTVTAVAGDSITVRESGNANRVQRFVASDLLASGGFPTDQDDGYMYRLCEVQVGDKVRILHSRVSGVDVCDGVLINFRPGGHVPPCHGPHRAHPFHLIAEKAYAQHPW
jgi:hypothetical protein